MERIGNRLDAIDALLVGIQPLNGSVPTAPIYRAVGCNGCDSVQHAKYGKPSIKTGIHRRAVKDGLTLFSIMDCAKLSRPFV